MRYCFLLTLATFICTFAFPTKGYAQNENVTEDNHPVILYNGSPKQYEIANIKVAGVKNYEDYVLIGISGLTVGQTITVPGDDITNAVNGMLSVKYEEKYIGNAEIRAVFKLSSAGKIAGSYIKDGKVVRNAIAKIIRDGEEIGKSTVDSLKIVKDEKAEVAKGFECGIKLHDNIDYKEGDTIEFYVKEVVKRV